MAYDDRETGLTVEDRGSKLGLPQNQDAEANVLAAMLLSPEVVEEAQVELQPDDFYRPIHKTIYTAMVDMYNSRIPIDSISLIDYLRSINKLDAVGGEAYILELMGQTLSLVNWQHHAAIVRRDSMLRELIGATNEINALAGSFAIANGSQPARRSNVRLGYKTDSRRFGKCITGRTRGRLTLTNKCNIYAAQTGRTTRNATCLTI